MRGDLEMIHQQRKELLEYIKNLETIITQQRNYITMEEHIEKDLGSGEVPPDTTFDNDQLK